MSSSNSMSLSLGQVGRSQIEGKHNLCVIMNVLTRSKLDTLRSSLQDRSQNFFVFFIISYGAGIVESLVDSAADKSETSRHAVVKALVDIGRKKHVIVLGICHSYLKKHSKVMVLCMFICSGHSNCMTGSASSQPSNCFTTSLGESVQRNTSKA